MSSHDETETSSGAVRPPREAMMQSLAELIVKVEADTKEASRALDRAQAELDRLKDRNRECVVELGKLVGPNLPERVFVVGRETVVNVRYRGVGIDPLVVVLKVEPRP